MNNSFFESFWVLFFHVVECAIECFLQLWRSADPNFFQILGIAELIFDEGLVPDNPHFLLGRDPRDQLEARVSFLLV